MRKDYAHYWRSDLGQSDFTSYFREALIDYYRNREATHCCTAIADA